MYRSLAVEKKNKKKFTPGENRIRVIAAPKIDVFW